MKNEELRSGNRKIERKNIRVVNVIDHMGLGGAQTIIKKLIEQNKNHYLFGIRRVPNEIKFSAKDSKRVRILNSKFKLNLYSVIELRNFIRENDIDVLGYRCIISLNKRLHFGENPNI